ncbi:MAG: hypothetical protein ACI9R3_004544 [Verrucomicrobiales bacterium]
MLKVEKKKTERALEQAPPQVDSVALAQKNPSDGQQ